MCGFTNFQISVTIYDDVFKQITHRIVVYIIHLYNEL